MLEFQYDGAIKAVTATTSCTVDYAIVGAGGGGGGNDSYPGSPGINGDVIVGRINLNAGETIYCLVGSTGQPGASGASGYGGGLGGYALDRYSGGTGGNAGPRGSSGSGGGGGGATTLWKLNNGTKQFIAIAAGGGGGGGGGNRGAAYGYIRSYSTYGFAPNDVSYAGRGGLGQHHQGDGGGPGGGGGGFYGGMGGTQPDGDQGAMSGSIGYSYNALLNGAYEWNPTSNFFTASGKGGATASLGSNGYAAFVSTQTDLKVFQSGSWNSANAISVRQNNAWVMATDAYVRINNAWVRVYGDNVPTYVSSAAGVSMNNTTGAMVSYSPPAIVYNTYYNSDRGGWSPADNGISTGTASTFGGSVGEGGYAFGGTSTGTSTGDGGDSPGDGGDGPGD
jgi:hypothetical protein